MRVGGVVSSNIELTKATFAYGKRKLDYNRESTVPVLTVEAHWLTVHTDTRNSTHYTHEAQPVSIDVILDSEFADKLIEECYRQTHVLTECHDVQLESIEFSFGYHSNHRDQQTFQITIKARGHHSKVMWEPSDFVVKRPADEVVCSVLRDIFIKYLNMDMGEYPRE